MDPIAAKNLHEIEGWRSQNRQGASDPSNLPSRFLSRFIEGVLYLTVPFHT